MAEALRHFLVVAAALRRGPSLDVLTHLYIDLLDLST